MQEKTKILIIEDEEGLLLTLKDRLEAEGYACETQSNGNKGLEAALGGVYGLILLDIMLPGKDGFAICEALRAANNHTPIIMLTARGQVDDRVKGLKLGADDYLGKPFEWSELLARIEALLRRVNQEHQLRKEEWQDAIKKGQVDYERFSVDFSSSTVLRNGESVPLSAQEFKLLAYLCEHPEIMHTRESLLNAVWSYGTKLTTRTVDVHIAWLRKKIGDSEPVPRHIKTVRGIGYRFLP